MKTTVFIALLTLLLLPLSAQKIVKDPAKRNPDKFYLKDGFELGDKKELVRDCAASFKEDETLKNVISDPEAGCTCMFEVFAKHVTTTDMLGIMSEEDFDYSDIMSMLPEEAKNEIFACLIPTKENGKLDIALAGSEEAKNSFIENCINGAKKIENGGAALPFNVEVFCLCTWEKLKNRGIDLSELDQLSDPNSPVFNELAMDCLISTMADNATEQSADKANSNNTNKKALVEGPASEELPILPLNKVSRVKVQMGTIEKYFTVDSGAEDVFISADLERQLLMDNQIDGQNYLSDKTYLLADGQAVNCRRFVLPQMEIGSFKVHDVTIAVSDNNNAYLLLGQSFLNKFSKWSLDNRKQVLHLEK